MINFKCIRFKNILSVGNDFVEFDLQNHSHSLLIGKSGHGKSTLIDALTFALFGRAYRDIKKNQLVNMINKKKLLVEVEFNQYKVVRGIGPNKFEIYCDGKLVEQESDVRRYQEYLEKDIIKMDYPTFCQIVVLGSAAFTPFMKLKAAERRRVVEELLDLQIFTRMNKDVKGKLNDLKDKLQAVQSDIDNKNGKIDAYRSVIARKTTEEPEDNFQEKIDELGSKITVIDSNLLKCDTALGDIDYDPLHITKARDAKTELTTEAKIIDKLIKNVTHNDVCPTCKQQITDEYKQTITGSNQAKLKDIAQKVAKCSKIIEKLNLKGEKKAIIENKIDQLNAQRNKLTSQIDVYKKNLNTNNQTEIDNLNKEIKAVEAELKPLKQKYDQISQQIEHHKQAVVLLKDDGIKTIIIEQYIPVLNKLINEYLERFDMFVSFELDSEFNETVKARHRDIFTYNSFSEGEKKRIDLSVLMAFRQIAAMRNSVASNLLIVDELLDGLDHDGLDNLEIMIKGLSSTNTIFISHNDELKNRPIFSKVYNTVKSGNFTEYAEV